MVCNDHFKNHKLHPEVVENFNVASAICECIEILANIETLSKLETKMKSDFKEVFEPILHVNELPTKVFASIHLKNVKRQSNLVHTHLCINTKKCGVYSYNSIWMLARFTHPLHHMLPLHLLS